MPDWWLECNCTSPAALAQDLDLAPVCTVYLLCRRDMYTHTLPVSPSTVHLHTTTRSEVEDSPAILVVVLLKHGATV